MSAPKCAACGQIPPRHLPDCADVPDRPDAAHPVGRDRCQMCGVKLGDRPGPHCGDCEEIYEADGGDTMHDVLDGAS